jgi:AsmA protein
VTLDGVSWVNGLTLTVSNVASRDLRLDAAGAYRALPFRLQVEVAPATRTAARPIAWAFDLGDLAATFRGVLVAPPSLDAEGQISVALGAGALRSRPLSLSREVATLFDGLSISGEGRLSLPQIQLRSVVFERGETRLRGGIDAVLSTTAPRFSGTLHAESLTIDPASVALSLTGIHGRAPETGVLPRWLRSAQADVRLSADRVLIGGVRVLDAAATTKIGGRLDVSMNEARLGGGTTKGRAAVSEAGDRLEARITLQVTDIDLAAAFGMGLHPLAAGIASGQLSIDLSGRSPGEMFDGASGRGQVAVRNGELAGLDVERFLRRAEAVGDAPPDGRSGFRSLDVTWQMSSGVASLTGAHVRSPLWAGRVEGDIDLKQRKLDLLARFSLERTTGPGEERALHMNGPLQAPVLKAMPHPPGRS